MITYSKKGWPIPKVIPSELESFLLNYSQINMQSEQGIGSQSMILGNSQASFNNSYSLNQTATASYQQSTVLSDPINIQRANTAPTGVAGQVPIPGSSSSIVQPVKPTAAQSADLTALTSLLDRVIKGYELMSKKYSDETDTFQESLAKLSEEKQAILHEITSEIELLAKEIEDSTAIRASIITEAQNAVAKSRDTTLSEGLSRVAESVIRDQTAAESFDLLMRLKSRLEQGIFPIRTEPLPELHEARVAQPSLQSPYSGSVMQTRSPPLQVHQSPMMQERQRVQVEEEDMFA